MQLFDQPQFWKPARWSLLASLKVKTTFMVIRRAPLCLDVFYTHAETIWTDSSRHLSDRIFVLYLQISTTGAVSHSTPCLDHFAHPLRFAHSCLSAGRPDSCTDKVGRIKCSLQTESYEIFSRMPLNLWLKRPNANIFQLLKIFKLWQPLSRLSLMSLQWITVLFFTKLIWKKKVGRVLMCR